MGPIELVVMKFRRVLHPDPERGREHRLVQFYSGEPYNWQTKTGGREIGGLRTVRLDEIYLR